MYGASLLVSCSAMKQRKYLLHYLISIVTIVHFVARKLRIVTVQCSKARMSAYQSAISMCTVQVAIHIRGHCNSREQCNSIALDSNSNAMLLDINPSPTKCDQTSVVGNGYPHTLDTLTLCKCAFSTIQVFILVISDVYSLKPW